MANTNCLEGIRCPHCGQEDQFVITVTTNAVMTDEGAEIPDGNVAWDDNSPITCGECNTKGLVDDFKVYDAVPA